MRTLSERLAQRRRQRLYRSRRTLQGPQGIEITIDGRRVLSFCSNDYLGLAGHPRLIAALQQGAERYGVGSGASHLVSGHHLAHGELEQRLADFCGRPRALLFSSGYMANLGVLGALAGRDDHVFADRLNHASLIDAARLSRATVTRYAHRDCARLAAALQRRGGERGQRFIVTDGVFSMDGDIAPLPRLQALAAEYGSWLMIDDAHAFGVLGARGSGSLEHFDLTADARCITVGTFGKALGVGGAFVAGSETLIETLIQQARTYIYTTAQPPALAHATLASLDLLEKEGWRRDHLRELISRFRSGAAQLGLPLTASQTAIQPLIIADNERCLALSEQLLQQGILISAIRPPTVPAGTARLRITLSAAHRFEHIERLLTALERLT